MQKSLRNAISWLIFNTLILCWRRTAWSPYIVPIRTPELLYKRLFISSSNCASLLTRINIVDLDYLIEKEKNKS